MSDGLLPVNATAAERALALATARVGAVPVPLASLWNPQTCPAEVLPWLAWALSVDDWDPNWSEMTKRAVLAEALPVHMVKGTIGAVRRAVENAGLGAVTIEEWFEYAGVPGTARLVITPAGTVIDVWDAAERAALAAKNERTHMEIKVLLARSSAAYLSGTVQASENISIMPWQLTDLPLASALYAGGAIVQSETATVYPPGYRPPVATLWTGKATASLALAMLQIDVTTIYPNEGAFA